MRRDYSTFANTIVATTASTKSHKDALPQEAVSKIDMLMTGTNNSLVGSGVDSYKVKRGSREFWNVIPTHLRALLEALLGPLGGTLPAAAGLAYTVPLDLFISAPGVSVGLPSDATPKQKDLEIYLNAANSSTGSSKVAGWEVPDREPTHMSMVKGDTTGIAGARDPGTYNIESEDPDNDLFLGFILPLGATTAYIEKMQILRKIPGGFDKLFEGERDGIYRSQAGSNPSTIVDPFFFRLPDAPLTMPRGSKILFKTGASALGGDVITPVYLRRL